MGEFLELRNEPDVLGQILVTGASGFIGGRLISPGDRALVRVPGAVAGGVVGDLLDIGSLRAACEGVETVYHCAGYAHALNSSDPDAHWRINFEGTRNLVEAAARAGVRRFVFLSSIKAMAESADPGADEDWPGEPVTPYGRAKRAAEELVLQTGSRYHMHVVNLRLAMVYGRGGRGNLERMARGIDAGWFPPLPETANRRSLVHVSDVVGAIRLVATSAEASGKTYIVADSRTYSGREIYDTICAGLHKPIPNWRIPASLLKFGGRLGDMAEALLRKSMPLNSGIVARLLESSCYSPARMERDLGWKTKISLRAGVEEMLTPVTEAQPASPGEN